MKRIGKAYSASGAGTIALPACYANIINLDLKGANAMANYRKILLAADFSDYGSQAAERALDMANRFGGELSIVHVVEPAPLNDPLYGGILPFDFDLTGQMVQTAQIRLAEMAEGLGIPKDRQWLEVGSPKAEIVRVATEQAVDLIVIGTHGRHGMAVLLGSTASSVIHHAHCDVLTVRLEGG
jgi:universal stress protein A